jgi:hypothetical protein
MQDLLPQNIQGSWQEIKHRPEINALYENLSLGPAYCWLNCQKFDGSKIPVDHYDKFVLSFHTEFLEHQILVDFFVANPQKQFLLISDWKYYESIFPSNVETVTWVTLHNQADYIVKTYGSCKHKSPSRRLSSLSYRHEFHKAAVTAYLLAHTDESDRVLSWWDIKFTAPYYLEKDYYIDPKIAKYVLDPCFQTHPPINLDVFNNNPLANTQWRHPAYLDCVFNLSNETVFNSTCESGRIPGPYLTDKTWKVLLSGTALLPVGQTGTLTHLRSLGLEFDYQIDLSYDTLIPEYDRVLGIFNTIDIILERPVDQLYRDVRDSGAFNVNYIVNGKFKKSCQERNDSQRSIIEKWAKT